MSRWKAGSQEATIAIEAEISTCYDGLNTILYGLNQTRIVISKSSEFLNEIAEGLLKSEEDSEEFKWYMKTLALYFKFASQVNSDYT